MTNYENILSTISAEEYQLIKDSNNAANRFNMVRFCYWMDILTDLEGLDPFAAAFKAQDYADADMIEVRNLMPEWAEAASAQILSMDLTDWTEGDVTDLYTVWARMKEFNSLQAWATAMLASCYGQKTAQAVRELSGFEQEEGEKDMFKDYAFEQAQIIELARAQKSAQALSDWAERADVPEEYRQAVRKCSDVLAEVHSVDEFGAWIAEQEATASACALGAIYSVWTAL